MGQDDVWGEHSWGSRDIVVLHGGPDAPTDRGRGPTLGPWDPLHISGTAEANDLKFCMHIEGWGPLCKSRSQGVGAGSRDPHSNFGTLSYLRKLKLESLHAYKLL